MKAKIISLFHYLLVFLLIIFNTSCQAKSINIVDTNVWPLITMMTFL